MEAEHVVGDPLLVARFGHDRSAGRGSERELGVRRVHRVDNRTARPRPGSQTRFLVHRPRAAEHSGMIPAEGGD